MTLPLEAEAPAGVVLPFPGHGRRPGTTTRLRSGIYEGAVVHHRFEPVDHRFSYRITMTWLDLAEVDAVCRHTLSGPGSGSTPCPSGGATTSATPRCRWTARSGTWWSSGPAVARTDPSRLLTQLRTWGWLFNPISLYYCFAPDGETVDAVVVEVTNTPWHEQTTYVLPGSGTHVVDKQLHVSPFLPMDLHHRFVIGDPGPRLVLGVDDLRGGALLFAASMVLQRRPVDRRSLGRVLWRFPLMTMRVSWGIYRQALTLRRRGVPVHPHPDRAGPEMVR